MHTALQVRSWEIPGPLPSRAVEELLSECPPVVNAHMQTEIAAMDAMPVEVLPYLEMHEITFFTSTVITHNFPEM